MHFDDWYNQDRDKAISDQTTQDGIMTIPNQSIHLNGTILP